MIIQANIKSGKNSFLRLSDYLKDIKCINPCILVDKNVYNNSEYVKRICNKIVSKKRLIFFDYPFEPSYQMLDDMIEKIIKNKTLDKVDVIVAIGGGSTMDTAKGLAILAKNPGPSINYKGFPDKLNQPLPVIAVPSTTGTGSEIVFNASFIDEDSKIKMGINYKYNYPIFAILDPLIPSSAPLHVLASSGIDALVHAIESYISNKTNQHVRYFSKIAYSMIMSNMESILIGKGDLNNWLNMQWAAVYAMIALSNSTSGPTGALSYYLGTHFKINHGIAGGVFIGRICNYNHQNGYYDLSKLYEGQDKYKINDSKKSEIIVNEINHLLEIAKIPKRLSKLGVKKSDLDGFNEFAKETKTAFDFNPVEIDTKYISDLFIAL